MSRFSKLLLIVFAAAALSGASFVAGAAVYKKNHRYDALPDTRFAKLVEVMSLIDQRYVKKSSEDKLLNGAVSGMIKSLEDPYSNYLDKKHFGRFQEESAGHFDGVGMTIAKDKEDVLIVESPIDGTPAFRAGVQPKDEILKIDGKTTENMSVEKAVSLIRGKKGTAVTIVFYSVEEKKEYTRKLVRAEITLPNVSGKIVGNNLGHVYLHSFNGLSTRELKAKTEELIKKGAKGLILDLRNNPGGLLEQAIEVTSLYLPSGEVVYTKGRNREKRTYRVSGDSPFPSIPMIVLVNKGSASASEIVAGALQDGKRALIVGEKTFGKGSVQEVASLRDGTAVTITTSLFYTPKGREIAKKGIKPDVAVKVPKNAAHPKKGGEDIPLKRAQEELEKLINK